jgi:putative transposase
MDKDVTHPIQKIKALKLRLNPNSHQKQMLNQWAGCYRYLYNKTIALLVNPKNSTLRDKLRLRNRLVTVKSRETKKHNSFYNNKPWLTLCPKAVRQGAVFQACANIKACFSNLRARNIKHFKKPYKTKKRQATHGWSMEVEKQNIHRKGNHLYIFETILGEMRYRGVKQLLKLFDNKMVPAMDCKIQKSAFGEYFLIVPVIKKCKPSPHVFSNPVAIDPGIRKYLTTYAPNSQEAFMMGHRWSTRIMNTLETLDYLYSKKAKGQSVDNQLIIRLRKKVFYLKKELRDQCASFISKRYDLILMPKLDTKNMCLKENRKLKTKTVRAMMQSCHGEFMNCLKAKCEEHGKRLLEVKEHYTSKTCPHCGHLNTCNEVYKCSNCSFCNDRDIVGALNIFLKAVRQ